MRRKLNGEPLPAIVSSEEYRVVDEMARMFRPPMERSSDLYYNTAMDSASFMLSLVWLAAGGFSVACIMLYFFVYRTLLQRLDVEIKNTRLLLLLVPLQVVQQVPAIKQYIREQRESMAEA